MGIIMLVGPLSGDYSSSNKLIILNGLTPLLFGSAASENQKELLTFMVSIIDKFT